MSRELPLQPWLTDGVVSLYHGDAESVLAALPENSVDCIVTSPPYNQLGNLSKPSHIHKGNRWIAKVADHGYSDDMTEPDYTAWLARVAASLLRVAKPGASMFFNHKIRYRSSEPIHPLDLVRTFEGWTLRQEIVWDRRRSMALNARMFAPSDERIYWMVKPGAPHKWNQDALAMSVWFHVPDHNPNGEHPCPFPLAIPNRCISATTDPGDVVLDPFVGSGTTVRAAADMGRRGIGIDVSADYLRIAGDRMAQQSLLGGGAA